MEKYLNERLHAYDDANPNEYRQCWGSVLDFIDDQNTTALGEEVDPH